MSMNQAKDYCICKNTVLMNSNLTTHNPSQVDPSRRKKTITERDNSEIYRSLTSCTYSDRRIY